MFTVITSERSAAGPVAGERLTFKLSAIGPLVVGEGHRLAADGEVATLRPANVVLGKQDPRQVWMALEDDPEEVEGLPLLELRRREKLYTRVDFGEWLSFFPVPLRVAWGRGGRERSRCTGRRPPPPHDRTRSRIGQEGLHTQPLDSIPV